MAELNIAQPMRFRVDVKTGLVEQPQRESLMKGDKKANRIIVELVKGSETLDITGVTVKGKFCRPPDLDEIELSGTAEGNLAIVQLTDACYAQSGNYQATVSLVFDDVERTVLFISGAVLRSGSGNAAGEDAGGGSGTGSGLPSGGTAGQVLVKVTAASGDASWKTLTATDVKARPDTWMPTAADVGALPSDGTAANANQLNGKDASEYALLTDLPTTAADVGALAENAQAADSAKLGGVAASEYAKLTDIPESTGDSGFAYNHLDNSNFLKFIAQAGVSGTHGTVTYAGDRWILSSGTITGTANSNGDGYSAITLNGTIYQKVAEAPTTATAAIGMVSGTATIEYSDGVVTITSAGGVIAWTALYEGDYTAENLPPYVPKGYAAELAECQRYYFGASVANAHLCWTGYCQSETEARFTIPIGTNMRDIPTVTFGNIAQLRVYVNGNQRTVSEVIGAALTPNGVTVRLTSSSLETGYLAALKVNTTFSVSADL